MRIKFCPVCGKYPMIWTADKSGITCKVECCDHCIATPLGAIEKWNQYAAAMDLAFALEWKREVWEATRKPLEFVETLRRVKSIETLYDILDHAGACVTATQEQVLINFGGE